ncbi:putative caspase-like protein [Litoreibacter ponti]|uniref:Putative caspase-like protein n=1 Tax=Litoreibacter ponti TaxID=1510457 RepID=A0A2T6BIU0_9RHOB|nr:caspase family protein [Litoreibacter ponti]PTX55974.1 putative caspase-like protein [Litoreibacter ponti]
MLRARFLRLCLFVLSAAFMVAAPVLAQQSSGGRVALVIGNAGYTNVPELKNPKNDSEDIADALRDVGFDVTLQTDLDQAAMLDTLRGFRRRAQKADVSLIYFAGHGIEIDRQNYLLPVDAVLETDSDINFEAVDLDTMIYAASGAEQLSMVIVDACRNNPFEASMKRTNASRAVGRGLIAVEPSKNTLVAYAAKEGTTAADGAGRNSPYAAALIKSLKAPKLEVGLMMRQVRDDVLASTAGRQEPFVYGSLSADKIYLNDPNADAGGTEFVVLDDGVKDVPDTNAGEIVFWKSISEEHAVEELNTYLKLYPNGFFVELARARIKRAGGQVLSPQEPEQRLVPNNPTPDIQVERKLTREETVELQERLSVLGHNLGRADGVAGKRTLSAIRAFERDEQRPILGLASWAVLNALREKVTEPQLVGWRAAQVKRAKPTPPKKVKAKPKSTPKKAAAPKKVVAPKAVAAPKPQAPPKVATPAPTPAPKATPAKKKKLTAGDRQFCAANRQCGTRECKIGSVMKGGRNCRFCARYYERCL